MLQNILSVELILSGVSVVRNCGVVVYTYNGVVEFSIGKRVENM